MSSPWLALKRHWFLFLLGFLLVTGMSLSSHSAPLALAIPKNWIIAGVLLAMSLPLEFGTMWSSLRKPGPALLATFISFVVVPLLAWPVSLFFRADLAAGIIIASAVPCSMASVTVWTRLAGGNEAVSILVTVITNLMCFVVTPAWVWLLVGQQTQTEPFMEMAANLLMIVVIPIIAGQILRGLPGVARLATVHKLFLSTLAQLGILAIVFVGAVHSGVQLEKLEGQLLNVAGQVLLVLWSVAAIHYVAWEIGFVASNKLGMSRADQIAVAFGGSQKTLMVGLAMALDIGGLAILPMLAYHVEQLLIDTVLASQLRLMPIAMPDDAEAVD